MTRIPIPDTPIACNPNFTVVAESEHWIVVNKAAPLIVHHANGKEEPTLLQGVEALLCFEIANGARPALVNRLDRETSGLVLIAKTQQAASELGRAMQQQLMRKEYLTIVHGHPAWSTLDCKQAILRKGTVDSHSSVWLQQCVHPQGKASRTVFRTLKKWHSLHGPLSLVHCTPHTGRTHQIRVHLAHVGHPIVGDKIYGPSPDCYLNYIQHGWTPDLAKRLIVPRHALHACALTFPFQQTTVRTHAPLPHDMRALINSLPAAGRYGVQDSVPD